MASRREQLQLLQKAQKRARAETADDDSILEEPSDVEVEEDSTTSDDQENKQPVQFQQGTTIQGKLCLWYQEFRYVRNRKNGNWFRCEQRSCKASLLLKDVENLTGDLGSNEHNHVAAPSRQQAETSRQGMKQQIQANPRARPFLLRAHGRADVDDEVFERMGRDEALDRMVCRVKNKEYGNVNRANPLKIQIPPVLLMKDGESTLVYDSRISRPGQADAVLVFSHTKLLDLLKKNRRWSLDGTFSSAPRPWTQVLIIGCYIGSRLIVAVQALLPGKKSSYYLEVLDVVRGLVDPVKPAKLISDFETSLLKAVRRVFPECRLTGCNFHFAQALFRKAKGMGIFKLFADEANQRKAVYKTFRSILSLALIPPEHVRRAFMLIVGKSVPGLQPWLGYFARNYIGLTQLEKDRGAAAFDPLRVFLRRSRSTERFATPSTIGTPSPIASISSMLSRQSRSLRSANTSMNATLPTRLSALSNRSSFQLVQRWNMEIVQKPRYAIEFWNVFNRAQAALERTNNGMESSHARFAKDLNHHPSLSDYLATLLNDVDKQVDTARAVRLQHSHARPKRNVIKEEQVINILDAANFDTDDGLLDAVHLIGLVMQGFVDGLRVPDEDEEENETSEEE